MKPWIEQYLIPYPVQACVESRARAETFDTPQEAWESWDPEYLIDLTNMVRIHPDGRRNLARIALVLARDLLPVFEAEFPEDERPRNVFETIEFDLLYAEVRTATERQEIADIATETAQEASAAREGSAAACAAWAIRAAVNAWAATTNGNADVALKEVMSLYKEVEYLRATENPDTPARSEAELRLRFRDALLEAVPINPFEVREGTQ